MQNNYDRPIKHVKFSPEDRGISLTGGGGPKKHFKDINESFMKGLYEEIEEIEDFINSFDISETISVVEIEKKALAKSHRPTSIFNEHTCPFVGDIGLGKDNTGQFLIKVSRHGLNSLKDTMNQVFTNISVRDELSTIKSIRPFEAKVDIENEKRILIRLISLKEKIGQDQILAKFLQLSQQYSIRCNLVIEDPYIYYIYDDNKSKIDSFVHKLKNSAILFSAQKAQSIVIEPLNLQNIESLPSDIPLPEDNIDYPLVAVVDTNVKIDCPAISPWIDGMETAIIEEEQEYGHGSFVAGLITNGYYYNNHVEFPKVQSKIFSVGVIGKSSGNFPEIKDMMERVQRQKPDIRVWNLSLGENRPASMHEISKFAVWLDKFQQEHNCICVIAAGNINNIADRRNWPPEADCPKDVQRISSPGDSVMGICVAAMSHINYPGVIGLNEPACYSRSGPVANLILKPDHIHYGGISIIGIKSISANEKYCGIVQNMGTSFATPLVSTIVANLWKHMGEDTPRYIVKGMLAHSAKLYHQIDNKYRPYYGWGKPQEHNKILYCDENEITIIFEGEISSNREIIHKLPFPIVPSMRLNNGKVKGEFFMTVSYDPPIDPNRAFEYCLVNVEAGLGEIKEDGTFNNKIPAEKAGFEYELIGGKYKWSPVKVYHKKYPQGVNIENWKLQIKITTRDGFLPPTHFAQKFAVILTIRALDDNAQVYNEMVRLMNQYNWEVSNAVAIESTEIAQHLSLCSSVSPLVFVILPNLTQIFERSLSSNFILEQSYGIILNRL